MVIIHFVRYMPFVGFWPMKFWGGGLGSCHL